jgi:5,6,7,8-tetrahydromethanopterin hydro-lyase
MGILDFLFGKKKAPTPFPPPRLRRRLQPPWPHQGLHPHRWPPPSRSCASANRWSVKATRSRTSTCMIGPARQSAAEKAFANCLTNNKDGFTSLLSVVAPNLLCKPATVMFNKVTIKGAKQAVQMFGPAQRGVAMAVADSVEDGTIPADEADNLFISVGVFIHWLAADDKKIQDYNYAATREAIERAVRGSPTAREVLAQRGRAMHPFAAA